MSSPETLYLESVLGVRGWMQPEGYVPAAAPMPPPLAICVVLGAAPTANEQSLLEKMLAAVEIREFKMHVGADGVPSASAYVLVGDAHPAIGADVSVVQIPALARFFADPQSAEVLSLKKQTWEDLKKFRKTWGGPLI